MDQDVTVVIAAKNEAPTIRDVVTCCRRFASQVLVVDGQSRDGTTEIARECGAEVLDELGPGKGNAHSNRHPAHPRQHHRADRRRRLARSRQTSRV